MARSVSPVFVLLSLVAVGFFLFQYYELVDLISPAKTVDAPEHRKATAHTRNPVNSPLCGAEHRIAHLNSMCNASKTRTRAIPPRYGYQFLFVNDAYKYVACLPPKAGCSTWKLILANNSVKSPIPATFKGSMHKDSRLRDEYGIRRLSTYPAAKQSQILQDYYKFMVVRHPLDRILSAYHDKIALGNAWAHRRKLLKLEKELHGTKTGSFRAFLDYAKENPNPHWSPATELCDPCSVNYHKIVKLETQNQDILDVISHLGPYRRINDVHAHVKGAGATRMFECWFPQHNIDEALLRDVMSLGFDQDAELFDYRWGNVSGILKH